MSYKIQMLASGQLEVRVKPNNPVDELVIVCSFVPDIDGTKTVSKVELKAGRELATDTSFDNASGEWICRLSLENTTSLSGDFLLFNIRGFAQDADPPSLEAWVAQDGKHLKTVGTDTPNKKTIQAVASKQHEDVFLTKVVIRYLEAA